MKLKEFSFDSKLDELLPALGAAVATGAAQAAGGAMANKAMGVPGTAAPQSGLAGGGMDPAQAAQAAKDRAEQKKQIQDQIKNTEKQLADLRKRLAELG